MKLTEWFTPNQKPTRPGKYIRAYGVTPETNKDYWDGERWLYSKGSLPCLDQNRDWRGLAEDPNKEQ